MAFAMLAFRICICIMGACGNATLFVAVLRDAQIRKKFSLVLRVLIATEALVDAFVCSVGFPLLVANGQFADASWNGWPCFLVVTCSWTTANCSFWLLAVIALSRVEAVYAPLRFRRLCKKKSVAALLVVLAMLAGHLPEKLGIALGWATITYVDGAGCTLIPSDAFPYHYYALDSINFWGPLPIGLVSYVAIALRLAVQRRQVADIAHAPHTASSATRKFVLVLVAVFAVNLMLVLPATAPFYLGFYSALYEVAPLIVALTETMFFLAIAVNPYVYYAASTDLRDAMKRTLGRG